MYNLEGRRLHGCCCKAEVGAAPAGGWLPPSAPLSCLQEGLCSTGSGASFSTLAVLATEEGQASAAPRCKGINGSRSSRLGVGARAVGLGACTAPARPLAADSPAAGRRPQPLGEVRCRCLGRSLRRRRRLPRGHTTCAACKASDKWCQCPPPTGPLQTAAECGSPSHVRTCPCAAPRPARRLCWMARALWPCCGCLDSTQVAGPPAGAAPHAGSHRD